MVTQKKYQHYVPKFYLRFFSNDDKSIGTYIKKHNKYTSKAPLDSIGGEDYLYGKDGIVGVAGLYLIGMFGRIRSDADA